MIIGYACTLKDDPNLSIQLRELQKMQCAVVFQDITNRITDNRLCFQEMISKLKPGDCIVVWKFSVLEHTLKQLFRLIQHLNNHQIDLVCINEQIDTRKIEGKSLFFISDVLIRFEKDVIKERTIIGREVAKARGRQGGRPIKFDFQSIQLAKKLYHEKNLSIQEICNTVGMTKPTLYKYLKNKTKIVKQAEDIAFKINKKHTLNVTKNQYYKINYN